MGGSTMMGTIYVVGLSIVGVIFSIVLRTRVLKGIFGGGGLLERMSGPKFSGAPVAGTASVIFVHPTGSSIQRGGLPPEYRCQIALRVHPSDGEPYDITIAQLVDSMRLPHIGPGSTVGVQVDSANPHNVRIDFNQPIRPAAS
jgi:hypothetical protein